MTKDEQKQLVKIAEMYYLENKTQSEISRALQIHRSTISRLLKLSREKGIVKITIDPFQAGTYSYEEELVNKFGLDKAIVVTTSENVNDEKVLMDLGKAANSYLKEIVEDDMIIGFSWGSAMAAFAQSISGIEKRNITCVPIVGGPSGRVVSKYHVNTITYQASLALHGKALLIDAPAIPETLELKKALLDKSFNQSLIHYWRNLNIAVLGIGSPTMKESDRWKDFYGQDVFQFVTENKVVGDVVSRFYDAQGHHIESELDSRIIGIDTTDLKRVRYKIGIAESRDKVPAIIGAIRGGYVNVLVTTQDTARELLNED